MSEGPGAEVQGMDQAIMKGLGDHDRVVMAHGGGGEMTQNLLNEVILPPLKNEVLDTLDDGAILPAGESKLCMTTDGYVVRPIEFPGGDIGRLAVSGTVNDLSVMGARPEALSLSLILEEGLSLQTLARVMKSLAETAKEAGVRVVTGDTKVIERRSEEGMMIVTTGFGRMRDDVNLDLNRVKPGDVVLVSGVIAEHGLAVMSAREGLAFATELKSDVAPLNQMIAGIWATGADVKFMRDATRAGVSGVLCDLANAVNHSVVMEEKRLPVTGTVRHAAEMLGLDVLNTANEGKIIVVVSREDAKSVLEAMRAHPYGEKACVIGQVVEAQPPLVELITLAGGRRLVSRPYGEDLPRIC